jgi:hypothetical protein
MPKHISLSDVACSLVPSRFSVRDWSLFDGHACRGFRPAKWPGPNPAQPSPVWPGPTCPWCPHPPMRPLLSSLSHLDFPRSNLPLPLPPLSPRGALGFGVEIAGVGSRGEPLPSPLLSLPLSPLSPCVRVPARRRALLPPAPRRRSAGLPFPPRRRGAPRLPFPCAGAAPARTRPWRGRGSAHGPRRGPDVVLCPGAAVRPQRAASAPCTRRPGPRRGSRGLGVASRSPVYP